MSGVEFLFYTFFCGFSGFLIGVGFAIWGEESKGGRR